MFLFNYFNNLITNTINNFNNFYFFDKMKKNIPYDIEERVYDKLEKGILYNREYDIECYVFDKCEKDTSCDTTHCIIDKLEKGIL